MTPVKLKYSFEGGSFTVAGFKSSPVWISHVSLSGWPLVARDMTSGTGTELGSVRFDWYPEPEDEWPIEIDPLDKALSALSACGRTIGVDAPPPPTSSDDP